MIWIFQMTRLFCILPSVHLKQAKYKVGGCLKNNLIYLAVFCLDGTGLKLISAPVHMDLSSWEVLHGILKDIYISKFIILILFQGKRYSNPQSRLLAHTSAWPFPITSAISNTQRQRTKQ